jgi:hypothetical protein
MVTIADIVTINGRADGARWVVADLIGSADGWPLNARIVRKTPGGNPAAFVTSLDNLSVVESPVFSAGERVSVGPHVGEVIASPAPGWVDVRLDAHSHPLSSGGSVAVDERTARTPLWLLTLENRL